MKETIAESLESCYIHQEVAELLNRCTSIDPRFKSNALQDSTSTIGLLKADAKEIAENQPLGPPVLPLRKLLHLPGRAKGCVQHWWKQYLIDHKREFEHFLLQSIGDADPF